MNYQMKTPMEMNTGKSLPFFSNLADSFLKNYPFSWFRKFAPPIEKKNIFAKIGKSMVYTLVGSVCVCVCGGGGGGIILPLQTISITINIPSSFTWTSRWHAYLMPEYTEP